VFAHRILGTENRHTFLHHGQQIAYLCVGTPFEPPAERRYDPQGAKPFGHIVRSRQFPEILEQLHGGKLFWR
jgi:hypothetical protein